MPGSSTTPGRSDLAMVRPKRVAFRARNSVGTRGLAFAAPWLAYALPYRRFVGVLTDANARLGADVDRYTFIVVDLHHLLLVGLPAHFESYMPSQAVQPLCRPCRLQESVTRRRTFSDQPEISSSLTSELKTELESSLALFRSYMGKLGFSIEARSISVEIAPGVIYKGFAAAFFPDTASIVVTSAFARDKVSVLRQLAYSSLLTGTIQSPEYSAIESGLATYFPCSFLNHPKVADQASAAGQDVFPPQNLVNSRRFSEIQLEQAASVMNDGSEIWGAAFWELRELLGQQDADRLLAKRWQDFPRDSQTTSFYASFVDSLAS